MLFGDDVICIPSLLHMCYTHYYLQVDHGRVQMFEIDSVSVCLNYHVYICYK